jgi:putative ABC transport system substrate-binding protein
MNRRDLITLLGGAAAWPVAARAQQAALPVIGFLGSGSLATDADLVAAFRQGLKETGFVESQNVKIEFRWPEGQYQRLPGMVADLVQRRVSVLVVTAGVQGALAAKAGTTTVPIIFYAGVDPIAAGLVASLNRPGGNITGITNVGVELGPKRLELLHELVPEATVIAALVNPNNSNAESLSRDLRAAARTMGFQLHILHASTESDFDTAFATLAQLRAGALMIGGDAFFNTRADQLGALTLRHAMPAIYQFSEFVAAGGLMSYGGSRMEFPRQAGVYAGRILKGEKPADLPVQQATKVKLTVNLKTAKALGLTIPPSVLARADEVIE